MSIHNADRFKVRLDPHCLLQLLDTAFEGQLIAVVHLLDQEVLRRNVVFDRGVRR